MNTDITYCTRECSNTECKRNKQNLIGVNSAVYIFNLETHRLQWADFPDCEGYKNE